MKHLVLLLLLTVPTLAAEPKHNWVKIPGGVIPDTSQPITTYWNESDCGSGCLSIQNDDGSFIDLETAKIQSGKLVEDSQKKAAKALAKAQAEADEKALKDAMTDTIKDLSKVKDPEVQKVLQAIINKLGLDQ
jgi:hypothetical protein